MWNLRQQQTPPDCPDCKHTAEQISSEVLPKLRFEFLGRTVCYKAFRSLTGVNPWRAAKQVALRERLYKHKGYKRHAVRFGEMYAAIRNMVRFLRNSSPFKFKDPNEISLPFHHKVVLFNMVQMAYEKSCKEGHPSFSKPPNYNTFKAVLRTNPDFAQLKFHRVVEIGRCRKCAFLRWKCLSAITPEERALWQKVAARHQMLQLEQKKEYWADRAKAAEDYPHTELYTAFDGGSGNEFWLPHLSAAAAEGPNKAQSEKHTQGFKVMNGLVHGDARSHVILSPACVVAGANHVCESILTVINTAYEEHGDLPKKFAVQLDNASVNHCSLVLAFVGLYVLFGVFTCARIRFQLPDHAHDIYDAFQGISKSAVARYTFYALDEMIDIIRGAHKVDRQGLAPKPLMGPDVLVSNLWEVRDFWEWLFPGHSSDPSQAFCRGSSVVYEGLTRFHDFEIRLEEPDAAGNRVGLWAKQYMSTPSYQYVGTLTTVDMYKSVTQNRQPEMQARSSSEHKSTSRNAALLSDFESLTKGLFAEQFSAERLADAMALCREDWKHFAHSTGAYPADGRRQWTPVQLAVCMLNHGQRGQQVAPSSATTIPSAWITEVEARPMRQRYHVFASNCGVRRGNNVNISAASAKTQPKTESELRSRPILAGTFVITLPAPSSTLARQCRRLHTAPFWLWKVLRVLTPGDTLPPNTRHMTATDTTTYEAQVYAAAQPDSANSPFGPLWDKMAEAHFLKTVQEKQGRPKPVRREEPQSPKMHVPLIGMLRPENILLGGFMLTGTQRLSQVVRNALRQGDHTPLSVLSP